MKIKLVNKLIASFSAVIILSITLGVIISNYSIDKNFNDYLKDKKNKKIEILVDTIENDFDIEKGMQYTRDIELLAKSEGFYINVRDLNGRSIFETSKEYLQNTEESLLLRYLEKSKERFEKDYYGEKSYDLVKYDKKVGDVTVGYYSVDNCGIRDLEMKNTIYNILIKTFIITLIIGIIISIFLAKHFSTPLKKMTEATNKIRGGNLKVQLDMKSSTYEINELCNSIDYLVKSLEDKDILRRKLTSDMAHEIRTPLTILQNTMEAFLYGVWEVTNERIESCYDEIIRLSKLVQGLKDIEKLEEVSMKLNFTKFNLNNEIKQLLDLFESQYESKDIKLNFKYKKEVIINSDKDKIRQVLINLLNNSYIYTNKCGEVEITLDETDKNIVISVRDNGIGISSEDIPFIFERFYRTDETRDRKTGGTGIGLTISKAIVETLGGNIKVYSKLGQGSTFITTLPI
ncbi:signal transduction histidine kinase [Gottschalkia acidurici 9a]|uniref:histidine kinase n=1 Tax=Gottschalkia acidurici (strain ATCC 7906 / DSM 604 / BCRC 14475 / CIP 104303 / KCTC 5404 / NCIMB 10678 / 9a) TaxID=1128398 RepID=K0B2J6_GOTA9|nr:HAMP domain-containing sensor histidine kinase [Gottschalkia acidurici]AFS79719.1 signal transduction histidine kinase [Gottschalkia acidurici 9a]